MTLSSLTELFELLGADPHRIVGETETPWLDVSGGFRPGGGAPKGNSNSLTSGAHSKRAQKLATVMRGHPNVREIVRIAVIQGIVHIDRRPPADLARFVEVMYPAVFDCSHPWFNQINQRPESGWPKPWPGPGFKPEELREI